METPASVMQLEIEENNLIASWPNLKSVNSSEFFKSFVLLFVTIREKYISKVILDSGQPQGGIISDSILNFGLKIVPFTTLKRIALLESTDFHWDNNLMQIFDYVNSTKKFSLETKLFSSKSDAMAWLNE